MIKTVMGTHKFQMEYIEYLQNRNTDLLNKLSDMKENYESKIIAKDMNRQYLISLMKDIINVCSTIPQEIDVFFEEMSVAMDTLRNILLKKSEMSQLVERISKAIQPASFQQEMDFNSELSCQKKSGTMKVSPMINGHVILTEPKIYLNRVSKNTSPLFRKGSKQLSPILEMSPLTPNSSEKQHIKEAVIGLEKIDRQSDETNNEFTPSRSTKRLSIQKKERQSFTKSPIIQKEQRSKKQQPDEIDPLEGPSWLLDGSRFSNSHVNFSRRKRRFAEKFDKFFSNSCNTDDKLSLDKTAEFNVKEDNVSSDEVGIRGKKKLSNRSSSSRVSRKKSGNNQKDSSFQTSPEFIEGTPKNTNVSRVKIKEEMLKGILLKQPLVALEDCMTNESLKKMISPRSTKSNDVKLIDLEDKKNTADESFCLFDNKDVTENICKNEENFETLNLRNHLVAEENDKIENRNILDIEKKNTSDVTKKSGDVLLPSSSNVLENKLPQQKSDSSKQSHTPINVGNEINSDLENEDSPNTYLVDIPHKETHSSNALKDKEMKPLYLVLCDDEDENKPDEKVICDKNDLRIEPEGVEIIKNKNEKNESSCDLSTRSSNLVREPKKKRRAAAPTNLCEPQLKTKLRRD